MRKLMLGVTPLLATAAFMVVPSMAAAGRLYGTGNFTAFPIETGEAVTNDGFTPEDFVLENEAKAFGIKCDVLVDEGTDTNTEFVTEVFGKSVDKLDFLGCLPFGELEEICTELNPQTDGAITGVVDDEVASETKVGITVVSGFEVICVIEGKDIDLGSITGAVKGTQKSKTNELVFTNAKGLEFFGEKSTITGTDETFTLFTGEPVVIG